MRRLILLSLISFLAASCGRPLADKPDLPAPPPKCPASLQADIPGEPSKDPGAGIIRPTPGSKAEAATEAYLNDVAAEQDWATGVLLPRAKTAKTFCDKLDLWIPGTPWSFTVPAS